MTTLSFSNFESLPQSGEELSLSLNLLWALQQLYLILLKSGRLCFDPTKTKIYMNCWVLQPPQAGHCLGMYASGFYLLQ